MLSPSSECWFIYEPQFSCLARTCVDPKTLGRFFREQGKRGGGVGGGVGGASCSVSTAVLACVNQEVCSCGGPELWRGGGNGGPWGAVVSSRSLLPSHVGCCCLFLTISGQLTSLCSVNHLKIFSHILKVVRDIAAWLADLMTPGKMLLPPGGALVPVPYNPPDLTPADSTGCSCRGRFRGEQQSSGRSRDTQNWSKKVF